MTKIRSVIDRAWSFLNAGSIGNMRALMFPRMPFWQALSMSAGKTFSQVRGVRVNILIDRLMTDVCTRKFYRETSGDLLRGPSLLQPVPDIETDLP